MIALLAILIDGAGIWLATSHWGVTPTLLAYLIGLIICGGPPIITLLGFAGLFALWGVSELPWRAVATPFHWIAVPFREIAAPFQWMHRHGAKIWAAAVCIWIWIAVFNAIAAANGWPRIMSR